MASIFLGEFPEDGLDEWKMLKPFLGDFAGDLVGDLPGEELFDFDFACWGGRYTVKPS